MTASRGQRSHELWAPILTPAARAHGEDSGPLPRCLATTEITCLSLYRTLVGDTALDLLLFGLPPNLSPERELMVERMELAVGGSAAIAAHDFAAFTFPGDATSLRFHDASL